jgi:hypothetical protein
MDVEVGSFNKDVKRVSAYNRGSKQFIAIHSAGHVTVSDARLKDNIQPVAGALDKVSRLRGVWFNWKDETTAAARPLHLGLLAQEVQAVAPEAVVETKGGLLAISSQAMTVLLLEAMKEQQKQLGVLRGALEELRSQRKSGQ